MYRLTSKLVIYRSIPEDSVLFCLADICRRFQGGEYEREALTAEILEQINRLLDIATRYGFDDNLWHNYLAFLLAMTETPFTLVAEKAEIGEGSVRAFAENDLMLFKQLFSYDFSQMEKELGIRCFSVIQNYRAVLKKERVFNRSVSEKVRYFSRRIEEADSVEEMYLAVTSFYRDFGVGRLGLNKAFRVSEEEPELLLPITATSDVRLEDLVGYELQKEKLIRNTEAFVAGRKANNVLLYGDAGTGKSTSVKAILNRYYNQGLRMIEIYKHQFCFLSKIISEVKNRNYRFIIYMDDLSFEEFETDYKYLKAVIEGGLEPRPDNVLIYATSNRRHLIRETWSDRSDRSEDELHRSDTVQEKLSLADRFGISIGYFRPEPLEYDEIVRVLASEHPEIGLSEEELKAEARRWELNHGGYSGRTARQFIDYLLGAETGTPLQE
ncbi:ATP-binding protein [Lachnoclostridium sp. Marseille-P6806]|uniref:ATP-binding protein n=1 Tax=Lachnoclostridium sp. Marseille-P6806 TaxID=2364793 RepID=UPI001030362C|nr:ATP-binding protein [Lachnoclostridium sp. Marseille-P6806]